MTWDGTTHLTSELVCGKTRVYNAANVGVPSAYPAPGADDFCFDRTMHTTDNGAYLKTLFDVYSTTFFVFENNGNDDATWYGIHENGTLRPGVLVDASKVAKNTHYTTGLGCQRLMGYCFKTDVPVKGIRIVGRGFDAYSISCIPIPEPATLTLLALGGAAALRRRTARRL